MVTGYADSFGSLGHLKVATNWLNSNLRAHSGQEPPNSWEIPEHVFLAFHSFFFFLRSETEKYLHSRGSWLRCDCGMR